MHNDVVADAARWPMGQSAPRARASLPASWPLVSDVMDRSFSSSNQFRTRTILLAKIGVLYSEKASAS